MLGLIAVMKNLADPSKLGGRIAAAFTATIYGIGLANLLFLPMANKLKDIIEKQSHTKEMIIEGIIAIAEGENPRNLEVKLKAFASPEAGANSHGKEAPARRSRQPRGMGDSLRRPRDPAAGIFRRHVRVTSVNEGKYSVLSDSLNAAFRGAPRTKEPISIGDKPAKTKGGETVAGIKPGQVIKLEAEKPAEEQKEQSENAALQGHLGRR